MNKLILFAMAFLGTGILTGNAFNVDGLSYSISGDEAVVTGASVSSATKVVIPASVVTGNVTYRVSGIAGNAFWNCKQLREVVIDDSDSPITTLPYYEYEVEYPGDPFRGCPVELYTIGRDLSQTADGSKAANDLPLRSAAEAYSIIWGGKSTFIPEMSANSDLSNLKSLTVGASVGHIYPGAFAGATSLRKLTIEEGTTDLEIMDIGAYSGSFYQCPLDTIVLGRSINEGVAIGITEGNAPRYVRVTSGCRSLQSGIIYFSYDIEGDLPEVILEDSDQPLILGENVSPFRNSWNVNMYLGRLTESSILSDVHLHSLEFGEQWTEIPENFSNNMQSLEKLVLPSGLTKIGAYAFNYCFNLKSVIFPAALEEIGDGAFSYAPLEEIVLPDGIKRIGNEAFSSAKIQTITLPSSLEHIGSAFYVCENLSEAIISDSEMPLELQLNNLPFRVCKLDSIYLGRNINLALFNVGDGTSVCSIEIGGNCTEIPDRFASQQSNLKSVTFNEGLVKIGESAFFGCEGLNSIVLPSTTEIIGKNAFDGVPLTELTLPEGIKVIGNQAFSGSKISTVTLPSSLEEIGGSVFYYCENLRTASVADSKTELILTDNYPVFTYCNLDSIYIGRPVPVSFMQGPSVPTVRKLEFGKNVIEIPDLFAVNHPELESVNFHDGLTRIGDQAFGYCTALTEAPLPSTLIEIDNGAFNGTALTEISLPEGLKRLKGYALARTPIQEVTIPASLEEIGASFFECSDLRTVIFSDSDKELVHNSTQYAPFHYCNIDSIYLGRVVNSEILYGCTKRSVNFGTQWKDIPEQFLISNQGLESVYMPETISTIGDYAFSGCASLMNIVCKTKEPPVCGGSNTFDEASYNDAVVMVPPGSKKLYRAAEVWKLFKNFESIGGGFIVTATYDSEFGSVMLNGINEASIIVDEDNPLAIEVLPAEGYELSVLSVNGIDVTSSVVNGTLHYDEIDENLEIAVEFARMYTITCDYIGDYGWITLNGVPETTYKISAGASLTIRATPMEGCYLTQLTINDVDVMGELRNGEYTIEHVESDLSIKASFAIRTFAIRIHYDPTRGEVIADRNVENDVATVAYGTDLSLRIIPAEGYEIEGVFLDGRDVTEEVSDDGTYEIKCIMMDMDVDVQFAIKRVRLNILGLEGGIIAMRYDYGTEVTIMIEPEEGWEFSSLTVDGVVITELEDNIFTTWPLREDADVNVVFEKTTDDGVESSSVNDARVKVSARQRTITVHGASDDSEVEVVDMSGVTLYRGKNHEITLDRQGVMIVMVEGRVFKVMLR